jgi:hypothetical protein
MLIGCLLPLALIFVLPLFGVRSGITLLVFIILMFMCHLMMMGGHGRGGHAGHGAGKGHDGGGHGPDDYDQHADRGRR